MSKRHQTTRRRSYGRRQHEMHERIERPAGPMSWADDDYEIELAVLRGERSQFDRTADWARSRGLD